MCAHVRRACSSPAVRGWQRQKDKGIFLQAGGTHFVGPPPSPSTTATFYVLTEGESCLARRERERRRRECGPLFSNCLYVSPNCECATAFHNGDHCLFGGESVGIFFVSIISRSLMFDISLSVMRLQLSSYQNEYYRRKFIAIDPCLAKPHYHMHAPTQSNSNPHLACCGDILSLLHAPVPL